MFNFLVRRSLANRVLVLALAGVLLVYPTINAQGTLMRQDNADPTLVMRRSDQASLVGQLNLPIYDGGLAAAQVR